MLMTVSSSQAKLSATKHREVTERPDAREKEVGAAFHRGKGRQTGDLLADRSLGNLEFERAVMCADDWIALVAELVKIAVVHPHVLGEFILADQTGADDERCDTSFDAILWRTLWKRRTIGGATTNHAAA